MKFSLALAALAGTAVASNWFGTKPLYNKWHETELERWLSDNNVPYPTPADRKDLETLIKDNWDANVVQPYNSWDAPQLSKYIQAKGKEVKKGTEQNKDSLVAQVKSAWTETEQQATDAYESVKDWIFDTWSESQLKAFLDRHGIPNPQPRTRDSLLSSARENYQSVAEKASEYYSYPGDWLYQSWSESDLKAWLDERGIPVPQPSSRDKVIAAVRRNSHVAAGNVAAYAGAASASVSSAGSAATQKVADYLLDTWSESEIKAFCDKNGIKVPQGSKKNEMLAFARKKYAELTGDNVSASAASAYGAATSKAGNQYAQATDAAGAQGQQFQQYFYEYLNWAKMQLGIGAQSASSYAADAYGTASASARSAASVISNSAVSAAYVASASAESAYSLASVSAASAAAQATDAAGSSASSAASLASKSAYSASSVASKSASSLSSSLSSAASSASVSASKAAAKSGPKVAKQAGDAAAESLSYGKHRVQEAYQKATDYVKEEL